MTALDPAAIARVASALHESGAAIARLAPQAAAEQHGVASLLQLLATAAPLLATQAPPAPPRPERLSLHRQVDIACSWFLKRQERFAGLPPPSAARDTRDAAVEIPGVSRAVLRRNRPIDWRAGDAESKGLPDVGKSKRMRT